MVSICRLFYIDNVSRLKGKDIYHNNALVIFETGKFCPVFKKVPGNNRGGALFKAVTETVTECKDACLAQKESCAAFDFDQYMMTCRLHRAIRDTHKANTNIFVRTEETVLCTRKFVIHCQYHIRI